MTLSQRRATSADAAILARIHHQVWVETYAAIAPAAAVSALTEARRHSSWEASLKGDDPVTLIAEVNGRPAGFVCYGTPTDPVFGGRGEIRHLYLLPNQRGRGHGLHLLTEALMGLRDAGHPGAALSVVEENRLARAFYERAGGEELLAFTDKGPLWRSRNRLVSWSF